MKQFDLIIEGKVVMTSDWIDCMQGAYTWLKEKKINPDDYVKFMRNSNGSITFAYYDQTGELIQIIIHKH